ncbi:MAG: FHA domain-containing protein [Muribaculaceae bacterium]|nr:FHA domain-containing protein [Muribaculaceae bacterium]
MDNSNFIFVKCPACAKVLKFRAVPNFREGMITCPHCGVKNRVRDAQILTPLSRTPEKPVDRRDESTNVIGEETKMIGARAFIRAVDDDKEFELKPGANTVGRQASSRQASIMFEDPEMYMSRLHATITFVTGPKPVLHLKDESSANGTFINDVRIPAGSIVMLHPGTRFKMGNKEFECRIVEAPNARNNRGHDDDSTMMS